MADVVRYVNPDSSGGDGTTAGLTGATAAYASLSAWEAAEQANLTSAGTPHIVHCANNGTGTADTSECILNGWTTDATNRITIQVDQADRHAGVWNANKYHMSMTGSELGAININFKDSNVTVDGLQIKIAPTAAHRYAMGNDTAGISTCLAYSNIIYGFAQTDGYGIRTSLFTSTLYNNTVVNNYNNIGRVSSGTVKPTNNICQGSNAGGSDYVGTMTSSATNISEDATSPDTAFRSKVVTFENEAGEDFHLGASDTEALGNGTDKSGTFTTDIDGETISTWCIGADWRAAAGGGGLSIPVAMHHYNQMRI